MHRPALSILICLFLAGGSYSSTMAQDKPAYLLLNEKGRSMSFRKAIRQLSDADMVFFGELHNDPIAHWLELEILRALHGKRSDMAVGFEMFETDQQFALDSLMAGSYSSEEFEEKTRLWPNYLTDYRPLVSECLERNIPMVASNAPRSFARQVSREGISSLSDLPAYEQALLAPMPFPIDETIPSYANMRDMIAGHGGGMNPSDFIAAQALKDATMAHRILKAWSPGTLFYHVNGSYHSDYHEGIIWYVGQEQPDLSIMNITVIESDTMDWEPEGDRIPADIIILVPANMTKTY